MFFHLVGGIHEIWVAFSSTSANLRHYHYVCFDSARTEVPTFSVAGEVNFRGGLTFLVCIGQSFNVLLTHLLVVSEGVRNNSLNGTVVIED